MTQETVNSHGGLDNSHRYANAREYKRSCMRPETRDKVGRRAPLRPSSECDSIVNEL